MITEVRNLPNKMDPKGGVVGIFNQFGDIRIEDQNGYEIVTFTEHRNPEVMAKDVAKAIELARNAGFTQGRQYVKSIVLMTDTWGDHDHKCPRDNDTKIEKDNGPATEVMLRALKDIRANAESQLVAMNTLKYPDTDPSYINAKWNYSVATSALLDKNVIALDRD